MRTQLLVIVIACLALNSYSLNVYEWVGVTTDITAPFNWLCLTTSCIGTTPFSFNDENQDSARIYGCNPTRTNMTIQSTIGGTTYVTWPSFMVFEPSGNKSKSCFTLTMEANTDLSIYQTGLFHFSTTDFRVANCHAGANTVALEYRRTYDLYTIKNTQGTGFNPKSFEIPGCSTNFILRSANGAEFIDYRTSNRRTAFRGLQRNLTFALGNHYLEDFDKSQYPQETIIELGNLAGYEPVWNIYGNLLKFGNIKAKVIVSGSTTTFKITWHPSSVVTVRSPWTIEDTRPTSGPNSILGTVNVENTRLQLNGHWYFGSTAVVNGVGSCNLTYVTGVNRNNITLGGTFNNLLLHSNSTNVLFITTGTYNSVDVNVGSSATGMVWDRQNVEGTATFRTVTLSAPSLTLQNGAFAFESLVTSGGVIYLQNANLTVAGSPYTSPV